MILSESLAVSFVLMLTQDELDAPLHSPALGIAVPSRALLGRLLTDGWVNH